MELAATVAGGLREGRKLVAEPPQATAEQVCKANSSAASKSAVDAHEHRFKACRSVLNY